jgi:TRAP-type C4-dicarboxylate transport system permease small subunit
MNTTSPPADSVLHKIDQAYHGLEKALNSVAAAFLFSLMLLACAEVVARKLFNSPIHGQADLVEISIPTMGFFGLAYCQRMAGHVRMEIVINTLKGRAYWLFEFVSNFATIIICGLMMYGSYFHFLRAYEIGDSTMDVELPIWPPKLIIFIGFCILMGRLIISFFGYIQMLKNPDGPVYAVPQKHDIEDIVEAEAEAARSAISDEDVEEELERESQIGARNEEERR